MDEFNIGNILNNNEPVIPKETGYKMIALRGVVVFPAQTAQIELGRDKSVTALNEARANGENIFLASQKEASILSPAEEDINRVGTLCKIQQVIKLPNDATRVLVTGIERKVIGKFISTAPYFEVSLLPFEVKDSDEGEVSAIKQAIRHQIEAFGKLDSKIAKDSLPNLQTNDDEKFIALSAGFAFERDKDRQELLETDSVYAQLEKIYTKIVGLCEILEVEKRIALKVRDAVDKNQKEYYLREQIKAIHSELGDDEEEVARFRKQAIDKKLPEYAQEKLEKELARMDKMAPNSPEAGVIRTYLEWMLDLPWNESTQDEIDLKKAEKVLDEDHYGLQKVKERIIEYLAVHKLSNNLKGAILCFVGPPGVGKTSIVSSIARASDRKLVQMSLGGVRDEAEIRGHRRTYIGAMPGRILAGMKSAGVNNPVFLLDEIDKMSSDFRGDPASAMLEVLDPNQNSEFKDHYLEIPYDLSKTMFVCTANTLDTIPTPLLDRMEVIELSGYTYEEKLQIAKRYLFPKQMKANGMPEGSVEIPDKVMTEIIAGYTKESGVRNLERKIATVIRKIAVKIVRDGETDKKFVVKKSDLKEYLGAQKYKAEDVREEDMVGRATGLAWTSVGGVTLDVEVALIPDGKGEITLTGNMGDVMKESAKTALSLVRSKSVEYAIPAEKFAKYDLHIHIPEGATPKDGPSAGITLSTAILSCLTGKKVSKAVAMTGEVTLLGNVLAIGGLKEKSLAAFRSGVKTLIIPKENEKDVAEIPQEVKKAVKIVTVSKIDEVFSLALVE